MKLVHRDLEKDSSGSLVLIPEETEDMWHVYNLIARKKWYLCIKTKFFFKYFVLKGIKLLYM